MNDDTLAIRAHKASIANAQAGNKDTWLNLFDADGIVFDPVGTSPHDPEGQGFRGRQQLSEFWDAMIAPPDLTIVSHRRIPVGQHFCACDMTVVSRMNGMTTYTEMIAVYEVNDAGKLLRLKVYWDMDKVAEQIAAQSR